MSTSKAKTPAKPEPAKKPVAKAAPAAKSPVAAKAAPAKPAAKAADKPAPAAPAAAARSASRAAPAVGLVSTTRIENPSAVAPAVPPIAPRATPARPVVDPKEVAAAAEYLSSRSLTRSEEPVVVVNGKALPTEEQLLKMPDSDYMNAEQLAFFKHRLQSIERELLANADETTEHLRETVIVPDPADRATIEEEHALELRTRDRERKLLKKVQSAVARIDNGDYGYCEETGDPIGIPRLLARPTATLSLEAQQRREMKQKLYGD